MLEDDASIFIKFDPEFPLEDVQEIGARLTESGALVPGYHPPSVGLLSIAALRMARDIDQTETVIMPDRNLASRLARLARDGAKRPLDGPTAIAVDLMAFAQAMDLQIDPSIAFHELAHHSGNDIALEELSWFRAADHGQAKAWIELSQGRIDRLPLVPPGSISDVDLAKPLRRWRRNYIVALKIAELELSTMTPRQRALALFQWMVDDFFMAGPAAIFATMYFAPFSAKRRMMKKLRSEDREKAIAGIKNAAWDITHLSHLNAERARSVTENVFFLFATADRGLAEIAPILMIDAEPDEYVSKLGLHLSDWWPEADGMHLAETLLGHILSVTGREPPTPRFSSDDPIQTLIDAGEARVRAWKP